MTEYVRLCVFALAIWLMKDQPLCCCAHLYTYIKGYVLERLQAYIIDYVECTYFRLCVCESVARMLRLQPQALARE